MADPPGRIAREESPYLIPLPAFKDQCREVSISRMAEHHNLRDLLRKQNLGTTPNIPLATAVISVPVILFVDDNPENNAQEMVYFRRLGYQVISTTSTTSALTLLENSHVDIIVSDMARTEEGDSGEFALFPRAGLVLLEQVRQRGWRTPVIFYSTINGLSDEVHRKGGNCIVSNNHDMIQAVVKAVPTAQVLETYATSRPYS